MRPGGAPLAFDRDAPARSGAAGATRALTRKASLNVVAYGLEYGAKMAVGLLVTPILVSRLGQALFGVWEMLARLASYVESVTDRPPEALKLVVANQQASGDAAAERRAVGGALAVWLLLLPIAAAAGAVLTWLAPTITGVGPELAPGVRLASALLVGSVLLGGLLAVPGSVLYGMNLGYKRMELQASLSVVGGVLTAAAAYAGLGLAGVGAAQLVLAALAGLCYWGLARAYVGWFGVARPTFAEVRSLFAMSSWLCLGDLIAKVLLASDLLVLGVILSPSLVATYVLTGYAARTAVNLHGAAVTAAMPGLGAVIGQGQYQRAAQARAELLALTWLLATAVGATILLWNPSFVSLWVGGARYAGSAVNLLIVLITVQTVFIRTDSYVIDAALRPWQRVRVGAVAAVCTLVAMIALTRWLGLAGLCLGTLTGRAVQTVAYPRLVRSCLGSVGGAPLIRLVRPLAAMALLFGVTVYAGDRIHTASWFGWGAGVVGSVTVFAAAAFVLGLAPQSRSAVTQRLLEIVRRGRRKTR
jgi:O-antigen/teichoic acid export membrane protein